MSNLPKGLFGETGLKLQTKKSMYYPSEPFDVNIANFYTLMSNIKQLGVDYEETFSMSEEELHALYEKRYKARMKKEGKGVDPEHVSFAEDKRNGFDFEESVLTVRDLLEGDIEHMQRMLRNQKDYWEKAISEAASYIDVTLKQAHTLEDRISPGKPGYVDPRITPEPVEEQDGSIGIPFR